MYILVDKKTGGVYAVKDETIEERVVQLFCEEDDAERYHGYLIANDYKRELSVMEVEEEAVKENCASFGYQYTIIKHDQIVLPPDDLT